MVFESVAALTASENLVQKKASQGFLKRFWNNLTGKNNRLQAGIDRNLARAQYASQQTLQKLAEQNLMSFELITAVNNKLNASMLAVEQEINNVYGTMRDICDTMQNFFRQSRADIMQLATRVERLERNVDLLNWQNSIEYQMYNSIEYQELDDVTKLVCVIHDFYGITAGEWRTSDLLLLKAAMGTIGLDPKATIRYEKFVRSVGNNRALFCHLIDAELQSEQFISANEVLALSLNKLDRLGNEEKHIVSITERILEKNGVNIESDNISYQMVSAYLSQEDDVILGAEVSHYELALEMLYNLEQLKYAKIESEKMKKAKALFLNCKIPEAMPLLEDCSDDNFEARYMLSKIYEEGIDTEKNIDYAKELIRQNVSMGYCNSIVQAGFLEIIDWNDVAKYKDDLIAAANQGDVFAQYELALYYLNIPLMMGDHNPPDYERALNYFELSAAQGYFRAHHGIALRYYNGQGVEQEGRKAESYFKIAADMGYGKSMLYLGDIYFRGRLGIEKNKSEGIEWYKKAYEHGQCNDSSINRIAVSYSDDDGIGDNAEALKWWRIGAQRNFPSCLSNIGWAYRNGKGVSVDYQKAIEYYKKGIQAGAEDGYEENNLGDMYLNGYGVTADRTVARSWYEKAANKGNEKAKKWLENNPT